MHVAEGAAGEMEDDEDEHEQPGQDGEDAHPPRRSWWVLVGVRQAVRVGHRHYRRLGTIAIAVYVPSAFSVATTSTRSPTFATGEMRTLSGQSTTTSLWSLSRVITQR